MKRTPLAGSGLDIFEPTDAAKPDAAKPVAAKKKNVKEMVYLPEDISKALTQCWLHRKQQDRSVTKSEIVAAALRAYLDVPPE